MKIYNYDGTTKEFIGWSTARIDQMELKKNKKTKHIIPKNATDKNPPENNDSEKIIIWDNGDWNIVDKIVDVSIKNDETFIDYQDRMQIELNIKFNSMLFDIYSEEIRFGISLGIYTDEYVEEAAEYVKACIIEKDNISTAISNLTSVEEVEGIVTNWPGINIKGTKFKVKTNNA